MKAPKLRGPFRNVRTEPRTFAFRSRHLPEVKPEWEERKKRVEAEVLGEREGRRTIQFARGGRSQEGRTARRAAAVRASRMAALRAGAIAVVLIYMTYRAILWVENQNFGGMLEFMKEQG
ncbi:MAG: hypothetical protein O3B70_02935 [Bacteroidetes bacterium]|nr:hypothetical protein [Bacteroidota bacterium]MDA0903265.1 hypothetical protein [Bacteroidota bacterium]MDA1242176.1 hypothetical protein [Bacteroidota bacterium]